MFDIRMIRHFLFTRQAKFVRISNCEDLVTALTLDVKNTYVTLILGIAMYFIKSNYKDSKAVLRQPF